MLAVIINMMIICSLAACCTEEPPKIAPVIMPGMAIIPMTLDEHEESISRERAEDEPHGVDGWCKREFQGLDCERSACFHPGGSKRKVYLNFVFALLEFLEHVANSHDNTRYRRSTEHPHNGN